MNAGFWYVLGALTPFVVYGLATGTAWLFEAVKELYWGQKLRRDYVQLHHENKRLKAAAEAKATPADPFLGISTKEER